MPKKKNEEIFFVGSTPVHVEKIHPFDFSKKSVTFVTLKALKTTTINHTWMRSYKSN